MREFDAYPRSDRVHFLDVGLQAAGHRMTLDLDIVRPHEGHRLGIRRSVGVGTADLRPGPVHTAVENVHVAEKLINERRRGTRVNLVWGADLFDPSPVHDHHPVGDFQRFFLIVRHEDARDMQFIMQAPQPAAQFLAHLGVKRTEGLVEQQDPWLDRECARQCNALTLAARKLRGIAIGKPVELNQLQEFRNASSDLGLAGTQLSRLDAQSKSNVLEH